MLGQLTNRLITGAMVHFVTVGSNGLPEGEHRAAIITHVYEHSDTVALCIIHPSGHSFANAVGHSEDHIPGTWHFIEGS